MNRYQATDGTYTLDRVKPIRRAKLNKERKQNNLFFFFFDNMSANFVFCIVVRCTIVCCDFHSYIFKALIPTHIDI